MQSTLDVLCALNSKDSDSGVVTVGTVRLQHSYVRRLGGRATVCADKLDRLMPRGIYTEVQCGQNRHAKSRGQKSAEPASVNVAPATLLEH